MKNQLDHHVVAYEGQNLYDFDNNILLNWYANRIIELTGGKGSLLELGLGHGFTTLAFSKHFKRHLVLDGSPAVIEHFKKLHPQCPAEIRETYFENFESDEQFDVVVLGFILEHVDDPVLVLKHYRKFVKPGGSMYISVPNAEVLNRRLGFISGLLPDMQLLSENDKILGHQRYYTVKTLTEDAQSAGYVVEGIEGIYLKPMSTSQLVSLNLDPKIIDALCVVGKDYPELCCGIMAKIK